MKKYFAASKIRAVQIRAMQNRASQGMPVHIFFFIFGADSKCTCNLLQLFWKYFFQLGNFVGSFVEMGFELAAKAKALGMKFTQASMYQINLNGVLP